MKRWLLVIVVAGISAVALPTPDPAFALANPPDCGAANDGAYWNDPETGIGYWCDGASRQFKDLNGDPHPIYTWPGGSASANAWQSQGSYLNVAPTATLNAPVASWSLDFGPGSGSYPCSGSTCSMPQSSWGPYQGNSEVVIEIYAVYKGSRILLSSESYWVSCD